MKELNVYTVEYTIQAGEYEKTIKKLVRASSEAEAQELGLLGEAHGDIEDPSSGTDWLSEEKGSLIDLHFEFCYTITNVEPVESADVETLEKYFMIYG